MAHLFKRFQRRFFRKLPLTALAGHEVIGISHGYCGSEVEVDPTMAAGCAGNLLQAKRHVWLCPEIKFHIGMDGEGVEAFLADAPPLTVGSHEPFIDGEVGLFADGTWDCVKPPFHFLLRESNHSA